MRAVAEHWRKQGVPEYIQAVTEEPEDGGYLFDGQPVGEDDAETQLYRKAVQIVAESQKASTSYLQRQLRVGYNSAARLIERMEKDGLVGQPDHVGRREVLIDTDGHPTLSLNAQGTGGFRAHSMRETPCPAANFQEFCNDFRQHLRARAGAGRARRVPSRAPAPAAPSAELATVEAHLAATQSMTADFLQTDGKGRQLAGTLQPQAARARSASNMAAGPTCCWSPTARR